MSLIGDFTSSSALEMLSKKFVFLMSSSMLLLIQRQHHLLEHGDAFGEIDALTTQGH